MEYKLIGDHFEIESFDSVKAVVEDYINQHQHKDLILVEVDDYKLLKKERTEIRKKLEELKQMRLNLDEIVLGKFNEQVKSIEKMIGDADKEMKARVDTFALENGLTTPKPKVYTITITTGSVKSAESVLKKIEKITDINVKKDF